MALSRFLRAAARAFYVGVREPTCEAVLLFLYSFAFHSQSALLAQKHDFSYIRFATLILFESND